MSFKDDMKRNEYLYFREWRRLKSTLARESEFLEDRFKSTTQMRDQEGADRFFWSYIADVTDARKTAIDEVISRMNEAEEEM